MKMRLVACIFLFASAGLAMAVSPWAGTYQGTATDKVNNVKVGSPYTIQLAVFNDTTTSAFTYIGTALSSVSLGSINSKGVFLLNTVNTSGSFSVTGTLTKSGASYKVVYTYPTQIGTATGTALLTKQH
jgi:hypothetical protein